MSTSFELSFHNLKTYLILILWCCSANCAEILGFFPFPAKSHHAVFEPVIRGLCGSGHRVTYVTPFRVDDLATDCTQIVIGNYLKEIQNIVGMDEGGGGHLANSLTNFIWTFTSLRKMGLGMAELTFKDDKVKQLIASDKKFDLIMLETTFYQEAFVAFQHRFDAPVIEILPPSNFHWAYFLYGIPYDTSYIVDITNPFSDKMNFMERLINTASSIAIRANFLFFYMQKYQDIMDRHFRYPGWENRPPIMDMLRNSSLLLMNSHTVLNYPYPLPPNVKEIGGIHLHKKTKPLSADLQDFMDGAKDGIIYFTLGSHIQVSSTLGDELRKEFANAFSKLKQRVLWKWEKDFPNVPPNVKISNWFPQQQILAHKNVKLFISHGGLLSLTEALTNAVPMVGIPILGDQPKNVRHMVSVGYGLQLSFSNISEQTILQAVHRVLDNPSYKMKAVELSSLLKDRPQSPLETALYWIGYVLRHRGAYHLRPAVSLMPWYQQSLLDVYFALAILIFVSLSIPYLTVKFLCSRAKWSTRSNMGIIKKKSE